ncbi:MAG: glycosyltransferase family 2 protein, partial [Patescibacteria group bacterium]
EIVIVPDSLPKTKPKACNYGLKRADGEFVVIYDAEDVPEPKQLKKAILAFEMVDKKVVCLQAKLNFYNPRHNILTRIFTAEYSLWFDLVLTGMQSIETPIPLGGTSNHFRVKDLRNLHAWDAFNVTEDADLGIRLSKKGYRTAILDSITLEEANSHFLNWIHQRTRWIKGYLQTYFVHTRNLSQFETSTRKHQRYTFQLVIGTKILSTLINPLMWATTITYFAFRPVAGKLIESFFPTPVFYMGVFCLVFGNFLYLYYYMIGCAKRNHYDLIKYAYFVPFYWLTMSYAGWLAVVSLIRQPHYWHKTVHGLHLKSDKATQQSAFHIGRDLVDKKLLGR